MLFRTLREIKFVVLPALAVILFACSGSDAVGPDLEVGEGKRPGYAGQGDVARYVNRGSRLAAEIEVLVDGDAACVGAALYDELVACGGCIDGCLDAFSGQHDVRGCVKPGRCQGQNRAQQDTDFCFHCFSSVFVWVVGTSVRPRLGRSSVPVEKVQLKKTCPLIARPAT